MGKDLSRRRIARIAASLALAAAIIAGAYGSLRGIAALLCGYIGACAVDQATGFRHISVTRN